VAVNSTEVPICGSVLRNRAAVNGEHNHAKPAVLALTNGEGAGLPKVPDAVPVRLHDFEQVCFAYALGIRAGEIPDDVSSSGQGVRGYYKDRMCNGSCGDGRQCAYRVR
jgi:hypothetical protein